VTIVGEYDNMKKKEGCGLSHQVLWCWSAANVGSAIRDKGLSRN
jgi:hypothetical protein